MKTFIYRGFDRDGARKRGVVEAIDLKEAREKLSREGIFPERIEAATDETTGGRFGTQRSNSLRNVAVRCELYRALSALLRAGLPLSQALEVMMEQPAGGANAVVRDLAGIRDRIREGAALAKAMSDTHAAVGGFESAVIESGERSGRLADVLTEVADYLEDINRVQQTLKTASIYPAVILALSLVVTVGVLGFLVPQLAGMFEESNIEMPAITRIVVALGDWFMPVILPAMVVLFLGGVTGWRKMMANNASRASLEEKVSMLPFVGRGFMLLVTTRFARTCSLLLRGGMPMVETVELAGRATGSVWLSGILSRKAEDIRHGESLSHAMAQVPVINQTLSSWVKAGEAAGDIPGLFNHAAERYRQLWSSYIQRAVTIIEPAMIILVAVFVLIIALAILLPILSIDQGLL